MIIENGAADFAIAALLGLALASAEAAVAATAGLENAQGASVGQVTLTETPNGVLLSATLTGMPPGVHAFHIHAVGRCEPPFKSAKGHFNPFGKKHGLLNPNGKHAGDLPNSHVPQSGELDFEVLADEVTLEEGPEGSLFDADGSAIVIHQGPDDYATDPAGAAGPRIACGVITPVGRRDDG